MTAATASRKPMEIREYAASSNPRVDREKGVIYDVKVVGLTSKNNRQYPMPVLREAIPLYEGAKVNIDHFRGKPGEDRPFPTFFGELKNVREGVDGLYADLAFLKSHEMADEVCEAAERFSTKFGLSQHANAFFKAGPDGLAVCEQITHVESVDIVSNPGATQGLFESAQPNGERTMNGEGTTSGAGSDLMGTALREAARIWEGEGDAAEKHKKIGGVFKPLLKAHEALRKAMGDEEPPVAATKECTKESVGQAVAATIPPVEKARKAIELLESSGVAIVGRRVDILAALDGNTSAQQGLIEEWKATKTGGAAPAKPRSTPAGVTESADTTTTQKSDWDDPAKGIAKLRGLA